jgi:hypothetical protein
MRNVVAVAALLAFAVGGADAASQRCYAPAEIEAEQAILFQTELMVVAEACRDPSYVSFITRNRETIIDYQGRMIEHFRRNGDRRAESALDTYLTRLANQSALRNGEVPVATVCAGSGNLIATANSLGKEDLRRYAAEKAALNRRYYTVCR